jgi:hypothetical protein
MPHGTQHNTKNPETLRLYLDCFIIAIARKYFVCLQKKLPTHQETEKLRVFHVAKLSAAYPLNKLQTYETPLTMNCAVHINHIYRHTKKTHTHIYIYT